MFQVVFLLTALLPYAALPFLRFPAETQPWAAALGWMFVIARAASRPNLKLSGFDLILVGLATMIMIHVYRGEEIDLLYYVKKNAAFLFSLGILFTARSITPRALWIALVIAVTIYVFFAILQLVANPLYQYLGNIFVPLRQVNLSTRGIASLSPEATDFGFLAVYLLFFTLLLMQIKDRPTSMRNLQIVAFATGGCVVASTSGSGMIALAAVLSLVFLPRIRDPRLTILAVAGIAVSLPLLLLVQYQYVMNIRGVQLLSMLLTSPEVLVSTTTFSYRFISNVIGLIALVESYGLGYGAGAFTHLAPQIYVTHELGSAWQLQGYYYTNVRNVLKTEPSGVFPILTLEAGLIGVALVVHLWRAVYRSTIPYRWAALVLMTLAWSQSFPVAWPPFWLLIGLWLNPQFRDAASPQAWLQTRRQSPSAPVSAPAAAPAGASRPARPAPMLQSLRPEDGAA